MVAGSVSSARLTPRRFVPLAVALGLVFACISGCDEADATSIRIDLNADGSGTLIASGIMTPTEPRPVESATTGGAITWTGRAGVVVSKASFKSLADVSLAGITFEPAGGRPSTLGKGMGPMVMRVTLPRGKQAQWSGLLAGASDAARQQARNMIAENPETSDLGGSLKLTINAPGKVLGSGVSLRARGVSASRSESQAVLQIPSDLASQEGDPIVWHVSWEPTPVAAP
ncbi:MAG: hypothetical protein K2X32_05510 [Phycisphaerales bacterium]|nr:hypothetical protein [Phycisphaerales bacterium]